MTTAEFIIALFYRIDNQMLAVPNHPQASLYPSEVVPLGGIHPVRPSRARQAIGEKRRSNHRWRVGGNLCMIVNPWGRPGCDWGSATPAIRR